MSGTECEAKLPGTKQVEMDEQNSKDWPVGESAVSESVCLTTVVTAPPPSKRLLSKRHVLQHADATKPHAKQKTNASHVFSPHVA